MTRAVVCPDKFRGTLTAAAAAAAMERGLYVAGFDEVRSVPLADGGEGTLDALVAACGGAIRSTRVTGPMGEPVDATWAVLSDGTAVVEMARASGLALVEGRNDPLRATTRGTGELIAAAIRGGSHTVIVALGGSATTDGGLGALDALQWNVRKTRLIVACDVETKFLDAAERFGPQKGATAAQVGLLSRRLERLAEVFMERMGEDVTMRVGGGAAGGLAGALSTLGATIEPGFDVVARAVGLETALLDADFVVTGEGKLDASSFEGKVVGGVLGWAADAGVERCAVIAGQVSDDAARAIAEHGEELADAWLYALTDRVWQGGEAFARAALLVEEAAVEAGRRALST